MRGTTALLLRGHSDLDSWPPTRCDCFRLGLLLHAAFDNITVVLYSTQLT